MVGALSMAAGVLPPCVPQEAPSTSVMAQLHPRERTASPAESYCQVLLERKTAAVKDVTPATTTLFSLPKVTQAGAESPIYGKPVEKPVSAR